ncbi:hypothetical protein BDP27DRAFT_1380379 [Rhodocollybia butyracea]|uniref:Protein CPL1-like domain-containing protein n=1 Tax=Rhodocollybia butyracea TaxID=206335 RepID=A0A9P5Q8R6_9AGAR|nr:hypothetical protein BDP27DRAFT_1380379 [Rhodocollybia butyracea]
MVFKGVVALAVVALAVPFAAARVPASSTETSKCSEGYFPFTAIKDCCLPHNGSSNSSPPKGKSCPSSRYWSVEQDCCVPSHPVPTSTPPQCNQQGHSWSAASQCCIGNPGNPGHPTTTAPSKPSPTPTKPSGGEPHGGNPYSGGSSSNGNYPGQGESGHSSGNHYGRRQHTSRSLPACPKGLDACPISGLVSGDYECLDTTAELESCGGCASIGRGQDCTAIKGAWNVGCELGSCKVYTCSEGYLLSADNKSCVPL